MRFNKLPVHSPQAIAFAALTQYISPAPSHSAPRTSPWQSGTITSTPLLLILASSSHPQLSRELNRVSGPCGHPQLTTKPS